MKLSPEEKIAQRVLKKYALEPPFDVRELIEEFADVEEVYLPFNVDAIFLNNSERPRVILNADRSARRMRFTIGHEIGHIKIPWHIGTLACHTEEKSSSSVEKILYSYIEMEANRFSAELLMPSAYIKKVVKSETNIQSIIETIFNDCQTSIFATCLKVVPFLEEGYVINVEYNGEGAWHKSPNTSINIYNDIDPSYLTRTSTKHGSFKINNNIYTVNWWKFDFSHYSLFTDVPKEKATEMIKKILLDVESNPDIRQKYLYTINGICGNANNGANSETEYFTQLKQRFVNYRTQLKVIIEHPEFERFLQKKAIEVIAKKKLK